jgi:hypothetical protein
VPLALAAGLLLGRGASAEEWHEAYRLGLSALARGDGAQAVAAFGRAVAQRPEPGRNVVTYGTNVEARYFPYLRLAEAHLALGQLAKAREALETSAKWGREPADERQRILARIVAAEPKTETPAAAPPAAPPPALPPPTLPPPTLATPPAAPVPTPTPPPPTTLAPEVGPTPAPPRARTEGPRPRPGATPPSTSLPLREAEELEAARPPATGTIEIVSAPPGARAYMDDELLGSTDPETGRLLKTGLPAGRHHVRVERAGYEDVVGDLDLRAGERASFYATLTPTRAAAPSGWRNELLAFALVTVALLAVIGWITLRRSPDTLSHVFAPTPRPMPATPPSATPVSPVTPGARRDEQGQEWFGDFRLLGLLGRGGMASVHKAERRGEIMALKRPLASYLEDPEFIERFLREAEIGRTLNHPNIARILERGEIERVPYFTMELLEGETLQGAVRRGPMEPRRAAQVVAQVAEALDFAHTKGVVHRDLKPSNIMLLRDGMAKVMDFGIARARRFEGLTATGAFLGTPEYLAPEAIDGTGSEARSDLYALGVVLFELLTGQRPFEADTPFAVLKMHCNQEPQAPSKRQRGVPAELDTIVLRLLRKRPEERPANAEELVVALRDWLNRAA